MLLDYQGTPSVAKLVDLVKITCNSTGTGVLMLGAAVPGNRGPEVLTVGEIYSYAIQQGDNYENGRATYLNSPPRFVRSPSASSNGGLPIDLQPNAQVALVALADDIQNPIGGNALTATALETPRVIGTTGDVTQSVSFDGRSNVVGTATITPKVVTNDKLADAPANTLKGATAAGTPADLTATQAKSVSCARSSRQPNAGADHRAVGSVIGFRSGRLPPACDGCGRPYRAR